ncbi:MAG TPA: hypothetical protein VGK40_12310 [Verrucomicrobiae bacterium]|jgi:hypothetical protein
MKSFLLILFGLVLASHGAQAQPSTNLLDLVRLYADTMIEHGRDTYGPQKSGLLLSALDRTTLAPLTVRPAPPGGIRRGDRPGRPWVEMNGANPMLDQNLLRVFYTLSDLTGQARYAQVADEELTWFFNHTMSPKTSLLPWGEHLSWDVIHDVPISGGEEAMHEYARPWVLWDRCFALAPEPCAAFALGVWEHQIANHKTGGFDRHAPYFEHGPVEGKDFPRHAGFYIGTWCYAWKYRERGSGAGNHAPLTPALSPPRGEGQVFLQAIETLLARFERKRVQKDGSLAATIGPLECELAATMVPDPLASQLRAFAAKEDELILVDLPKQLRGQTNTYIPPKWQTGYSAGTLASSAMFCLARHEQTGQPAYRDLLIGFADAYLNSRPEEDVDAWPMSFAHAISTEVAAYRFTKRPAYLEQARRFARMAVEIFWQDNPLPRASMKTGHYETITGADSLALALLEVHAADHGLTNRIPSNTIDR